MSYQATSHHYIDPEQTSVTKEVWVVDDDSSIRWVLDKALTKAGYQCRCFENGKLALDQLNKTTVYPAVLISDIKMPEVDGLTLLNYIKQHYPQLPVLIMTAHSDLEAAVNAYQQGAFDYLPKPFDVNDVLHLVEQAIAQTITDTNSINETNKSSTGIIGEAPAMQEVFKVIGRLSRSSISVLINGESGTGKELIAQALHTHSPRATGPFIALNMAAIPKDLIESELFGHEKGAFTGANQIRHGRFEQANGGTLFLDEIGDMPLDVQTRLLRVLADGQFYRIGGYSPIKVDVRIIAATHQNLELKVQQHQFREDLFHRLNVIKITLPPLRERVADIEALANHFLLTTAKELGVEHKHLTTEALHTLQQFNWPGNVRQLENVCRWLTVMSSGKEILAADLPDELTNLSSAMPTIANEQSITQNANNNPEWQQQFELWVKQQLSLGKENLLEDVTYTIERTLLENALTFTRGHKQDAAKILGWGRNTLTRKIKELDLSEY